MMSATQKPEYVGKYVNWNKLSELEKEDFRVIYKRVMEALRGFEGNKNPGAQVTIHNSGMTDYKVKIISHSICFFECVLEALKQIDWKAHIIDIYSVGNKIQVTIWI